MAKKKNILDIPYNEIDWENITREEFEQINLRMLDEEQKEWEEEHKYDHVLEIVPLEDC